MTGIRIAAAWVACVVIAGVALSARAHDGKIHGTQAEAQAHLRAVPGAAKDRSSPAGPFPVEIELGFDLVDQHGRRRTQTDFAGRPLAIFFGYANCRSICSVALPRLAAAVDLADAAGVAVQPVLITVDPQRDMPDALARVVPDIHPRLVGLTGSEEELAATRATFQVASGIVSEDAEGAPIYAHGSFIYLFDGDGELLSVMPPVLGPERMAVIITNYLGGEKNGS